MFKSERDGKTVEKVVEGEVEKVVEGEVDKKSKSGWWNKLTSWADLEENNGNEKGRKKGCC